MAGDIEVLF